MRSCDCAKFVFGATVGARDRPLLEILHRFLGVGSIHVRVPRNPEWQPEVTFTVNSIRAHRRTTIPFADRYLIAGKKREQYLRWKEELRRYAEERSVRWGMGRSICSAPGCEGVVRGRMLCRRHYYLARHG